MWGLEGKAMSVESFGASTRAGILLQGIWAHCGKCCGLCQRVDVIQNNLKWWIIINIR
jgi:hypothetical protein